MKRVALALSVAALAVVACKKGEEAQPPQQPAAAPAAAPAATMDTSKMAMDTAKGAMKADTSKAGMKKGEMKKHD